MEERQRKKKTKTPCDLNLGQTLRPGFYIFETVIDGKKNGEGDHATAGGETQTTPSSREVFPGISLNACPETEGTGGTLSVAYVQKWNN